MTAVTDLEDWNVPLFTPGRCTCGHGIYILAGSEPPCPICLTDPNDPHDCEVVDLDDER